MLVGYIVNNIDYKILYMLFKFKNLYNSMSLITFRNKYKVKHFFRVNYIFGPRCLYETMKVVS